MIFVVGSINVDLVVYSERFPEEGETLVGKNFFMNQGGKGANQAVSSKKAGGDVLFLGRVGDDYFGKFVEAEIKRFSVESNLEKVKDVSTGIALINVDREGKNKIVIIPGANALVGEREVDILRRDFKEGDFLLLQGEIPIEANVKLSRIAHEKRGTVIFDPTPVDESLLRVIPYCTIVTPNEVEVKRLTGNSEVVDGAKRLLDYGAESVIVKMGERGGFYMSKEESFFFPSFNVNPVDTTGAGDTFNGSLASALFLGINMKDAIKYASAASAISVTRKGAATSSPLKEEIINFLEEKGEKVNY